MKKNKEELKSDTCLKCKAVLNLEECSNVFLCKKCIEYKAIYNIKQVEYTRFKRYLRNTAEWSKEVLENYISLIGEELINLDNFSEEEISKIRNIFKRKSKNPEFIIRRLTGRVGITREIIEGIDYIKEPFDENNPAHIDLELAKKLEVEYRYKLIDKDETNPIHIVKGLMLTQFARFIYNSIDDDYGFFIKELVDSTLTNILNTYPFTEEEIIKIKKYYGRK